MPDLTRRALLLATVASAALAGCRDDAPPPHVPTTDERARDAAAALEQAAADEYAAAMSAHAELTAHLKPLADHHRRHIAVLVHPPSPSPPTRASSVPLVTVAALAVRRLAAAEQRLAQAHLAALDAVSPSLALLLASLAASAAANAAELGRRA